jgi:hypothetical protein
VWDEHRNTSRVFPVSPDALPAALKACAGIEPALRRWVEDGHPTLTEAEHVQRFGESYVKHTAKASRTAMTLSGEIRPHR